MTDDKRLTLKQWQRRALKAEAELESIRNIRVFEHSLEMRAHHQISAYRVALKEAQEAIAWALEEA